MGHVFYFTREDGIAEIKTAKKARRNMPHAKSSWRIKLQITSKQRKKMGGEKLTSKYIKGGVADNRKANCLGNVTCIVQH